MEAPRPETQAATTWSERIVGTGHEAPSALMANPKNWRTHPEAQAATMSAVLDEVGWVTQVIVNRSTGHLVDGHLRVALALERQEPAVPVCYVELSEEEEALVLATFDPISMLAIPDPEKISALLSSLEVSDTALAAMLASIVPPVPLAPPCDPDAIPQAPVDPLTQPGDQWRIGPHRLLCADARDPSAWSRLMGQERADLVLSDPPYGIDYIGKTPRRLRIKGDDRDEGALGELLCGVLTQALANSRAGYERRSKTVAPAT